MANSAVQGKKTEFSPHRSPTRDYSAATAQYKLIPSVCTVCHEKICAANLIRNSGERFFIITESFFINTERFFITVDGVFINVDGVFINVDGVFFNVDGRFYNPDGRNYIADR